MSASGVHFVLQTQQLGTGHAVQCLAESVHGLGDLLVLSGDVPLIRPETIEHLRNFHQTQKAAMTILTARPENPFGYGRVIRVSPSSPEVAAIVEQKALAAISSISEKLTPASMCFISTLSTGILMRCNPTMLTGSIT